MDELIQQITQKTGVSQQTAQEIVNMVVSRLKQRVPAPLANSLDQYLSGSSSNTGSAEEQVKSAVSGLGSLGKKNE